MVSGLSSSSLFTSNTSPEAGQKTSDTALTDSILPTASPSSITVPTSGSSTNTMSPSCAWAKSEIPKVRVSPSIRTHSWSLVYFNSERISMTPLYGLFADLPKRRLDPFGRDFFVANFDHQQLVLGMPRIDIGNGNALAQAGAVAAAGDFSHFGTGLRKDFKVVAGHTFFLQHQINKAGVVAALLDCMKGVLANEVVG